MFLWKGRIPNYTDPMLEINYFAQTDFRGERKIFGIKREDRRLHMYIVGRTGMGKTTLLLNMILNDVYGGEGFASWIPMVMRWTNFSTIYHPLG